MKTCRKTKSLIVQGKFGNISNEEAINRIFRRLNGRCHIMKPKKTSNAANRFYMVYRPFSLVVVSLCCLMFFIPFLGYDIYDLVGLLDSDRMFYVFSTILLLVYTFFVLKKNRRGTLISLVLFILLYSAHVCLDYIEALDIFTLLVFTFCVSQGYLSLLLLDKTNKS